MEPKITVEELNKLGIKCTELEDCPGYNVARFPRLVYDSKSAVNKAAEKNVGLYGITALMYKFGRINRWNIVRCVWNANTKSFDATILENAKIKGTVHVSYEDICKTMWWHSFEIVGYDTIRPIEYTFDEREDVMRPLVEKSRRAYEKFLKEHPELRESDEKTSK